MNFLPKKEQAKAHMWFDGIRQPDTIYVASVSRGKDSTAMLEAIKLMQWPLDMIVSTDVWFDEDTPAELPPLVKFKDEWDNKCLLNFGVPVTRLCATKRERESSADGECHSRLSYTSMFYTWKEHKRGGRSIYGFPVRCGAWCNSRLKFAAVSKENILRCVLQNSQSKERESLGGFPPKSRGSIDPWIPSAGTELVQQRSQENTNYTEYTGSLRCEGIGAQPSKHRRSITGFPTRWSQYCTGELKLRRKFFSNMPHERGAKTNIVQYIGIAADEPKRIARHLSKADIVLPLVQIGWDEDLCGLTAAYLDMLSPTYETGERDGCWFCHNQGVNQLRNLRKNYPDLWAKLMKLDIDSPVTFHADGHTVHDFDKRFEYEEKGWVPTDKRFKWKMLDTPIQLSIFDETGETE